MERGQDSIYPIFHHHTTHPQPHHQIKGVDVDIKWEINQYYKFSGN